MYYCVTEKESGVSRAWSGEDLSAAPPTADVARCDLLAQLGALLRVDSSSQHTVPTQPVPPRSTSSPAGMLRPAPDDSVPPPCGSTGSTVPNHDDSVDSSTSGMLCHKTSHDVRCSTCGEEVMGSTLSQVAIRWLLLEWVTCLRTGKPCLCIANH